MLKPNRKYFPQQPTSGSWKCWCLPGMVSGRPWPGDRSPSRAGPALRGLPWARAARGLAGRLRLHGQGHPESPPAGTAPGARTALLGPPGTLSARPAGLAPPGASVPEPRLWAWPRPRHLPHTPLPGPHSAGSAGSCRTPLRPSVPPETETPANRSTNCGQEGPTAPPSPRRSVPAPAQSPALLWELISGEE